MLSTDEAEVSPIIYEDEVCRARLQMLHNSVPIMHAVVFKFSPSIYKRLLLIMQKIKEKLVSYGYHVVYAMANKDNHKLIKFCEMMGFIEIGSISQMIVFAQEC